MNFTVLGLLGPAGSGKDLVADWLCDKGFVKIAFADPMKRFVQKTFGLTEDQLWGPSQERNREFLVDDNWWYAAIGAMPKAVDEILNQVLQEGDRARGYLALMDWFNHLRKDYREKISARVILQTLGTEWGREVDPLMWARYAHKVARDLSFDGVYSQQGGWSLKYEGKRAEPRGVVIPDHRFVNELKTTQSAGGYVIRLRRLAQEEKTIGIAGHKSEAEQKTVPDDVFDLVLEFPEGIDKVHAILRSVLQEEAWTTKRRNGYQVQYRSS